MKTSRGQKSIAAVLLLFFNCHPLQCASLAVPRSRNKADFVKRRQAGIKQRGSSKRTPRWEQEGDQLYQEIPIDKNIDYQQACEKLRDLEEKHIQSYTAQKPKSNPSETQTTQKSAPPHMIWGTLPVGPILKNQLDATGVKEPTPIQEASFALISKGQNAVIASPTGTGKTLAYLVPLLATKNRAVGCQILIVTPTVELAFQIQGEVDRLWLPTPEGGSAAHVIGSDSDKQQSASLLDACIVKKPILCGTPRRIRDFLEEIRADSLPEAREIGRTWKSNLKTIVLDEADRLLRTEGDARRKEGAKDRPAPTQAQMLLYQLGDMTNYQLVCASATVGRTLRRQLMELKNAPSIDKASIVITADTRATGKDVHKRRAALLPETISHSCALVPESEEDKLNVLSSVITSLSPSPCVIFPGRMGVKQVQEHLQKSIGSENILSINDVNNNGVGGAGPTWKTSPVYVVPDKFARGLDIEGVERVFLLSPPASAAAYMHLAGRTGRNGKPGQAITIVHPAEVGRLAIIADRLGVSFRREELGRTAAAETKLRTTQKDDKPTGDTMSYSKFSSAQLMRKTIAELKLYMEDNDIVIPHGKKVLKADLVAAIRDGMGGPE